MTDTLLQLDSLSAGYGTVDVLQDISLTLGEGEFIAVVGPNGAGKSTLFKTISGIVTPSRGTMTLRGENLLQLFAAELEYDASGAITGVGREVQLTDNEHVNWAPYWHPSGRFMLYTTSEQGHSNYELYAIEFAPERAEPRKVRVTSHDRFDGLGVFSADGRWMMWTAQRSPEGSSQLWIARFDAGPILGSAVP